MSYLGSDVASGGQHNMSDELLGRRLRLERERRRITLESIAANTKISVTLLKALECDDVSRWPSGIFRRSFIRTYAEAIGLDADEIMQEFLERYPDPLAASALVGDPEAQSKRAAQHTVLRLTLADTSEPFLAGHVLSGIGSRLSAVAWDAGTTLAFALTAYVFFETFWAPLGVFMLCYYLGSVLILGNTPGVSLFAPGVNGRVGGKGKEADATHELDEHLGTDAFEHALR